MSTVSGKYQLLAIGGSAGSLVVVLKIVESFQHLQVPVIIVLHRKDEQDNLLVQLLSTRTQFLVKEAEDKESLMPGVIYVAPPDYHLLLEKDRSFSLDLSERVNYSRPSIDVSFETAADAYGDRLICVLLSGGNNDGASGLQKVRALGGLVIVQDPASADIPYMPQHAIALMQPDHIVHADQMGRFVNDLLK